MTPEANNEIKMDISAEQKAFTPALTSSKESIPLQVDLKDSLPLEKPLKFESQMAGPELIASIPYEAHSLNADGHKISASPEVAHSATSLQIKFDPEKAFKELKENVVQVQKNVESVTEHSHPHWIPLPRPANNFEERPTLEQTNLVFEQRRQKFSDYPRWA